MPAGDGESVSCDRFARLRRSSSSIGSFSTLSFRDRFALREEEISFLRALLLFSLPLSLAPGEKISAGGAREIPFLSEN